MTRARSRRRSRRRRPWTRGSPRTPNVRRGPSTCWTRRLSKHPDFPLLGAAHMNEAHILGFVVGFLVGGILTAIAMTLIAHKNPTQVNTAAADILASEARVVGAVNGAKDAVIQHQATVAVASAPSAPPAATP